MAENRKQVPLSFNMNDPFESEIYEWLEQMKGENKKGNVSAIIKKILFAYIDREKERLYVTQKLKLLGVEDQLVDTKINQIGFVPRGPEIEQPKETSEQERNQWEDTEVDDSTLPF